MHWAIRTGVVVLSVAAGLVIGFAVLHCGRQAPQGSVQRRTPAAFKLDLGIIHLAQRAHANHVTSREVLVTNRSKEAFSIYSHATSCNCTSVEYPKELLPPGGSARVRLTFNDPSKGTGGYFEGRVVLRTTGGRGNDMVQMEYCGFVSYDVLCLPDMLLFDTLEQGIPSPVQDLIIVTAKLRYKNDTLVKVSPRRIASVSAPKGVSVSAMPEAEVSLPFTTRNAAVAFLPRAAGDLLGRTSSDSVSNLTPTQKIVARLAAEGNQKPAEWWQTFGFRVQVPKAESSLDDVVLFRLSDGQEIRVPIKLDVRKNARVFPDPLLLASCQGQPEKGIFYIEVSAGLLEVISIESNPPGLAKTTVTKEGDRRAKVEVQLVGPADLPMLQLQVDTNHGRVELTCIRSS